MYLGNVDAWMAHVASETSKPGELVQLPDDEQAYFNEIGEEYERRYREGCARVCATFLLTGLETPWTPAPVLARSDIVEELLPLFLAAPEIPRWDAIEDRLRQLLASGLTESRTRIELHLSVIASISLCPRRRSDATQSGSTDPRYGPPRTRTFSTPGVGVLDVSMDWAEPDDRRSVVELVLHARTSASARGDYARWMAGVVATCLLVVADENHSTYPASLWFGGRSPLDTARAVDDEMFAFLDVPLGEASLPGFLDLVCASLHPSVTKDGGGLLVPESQLKSGIWTFADFATSPLDRGALAAYLSVFHSCVSVLYEPQQKKVDDAAGHCIRVLGLRGADERKALRGLFGIRNAALHGCDPRFVSLQVYIAWHLARAALHALAGKALPPAQTKRAKPPRPEPTFSDRVGEILRIGGVQNDWVFQDFP